MSNGGSAFPRPASGRGGDDYDAGADGMPLRDYFAAQALVGIVSRMGSETYRRYVSGEADGREMDAAYRFADAMLRARKAKVSGDE